MNYDYPQSDLSRSVLGGLFAGIIAAATNMIFVFVYRRLAEFYDFNSIDVTVIVFGSLLQSIVCGLVFYFLVHYMRKGITVYRVMVLVVTIIIIYLGIMFRASFEGQAPPDFRVLVVGTQMVIGGLAVFLIPYLFRHDSIIS